ncbi:Protein tyrosine kinase, partial [Trichostrongylus colubriformis]
VTLGQLSYEPLGYNLYFNDSVATITQRDEPIITRNSAYAAVGLLALLVLLVIASCVVLLRRRKPQDKFNVFEEDIRKSLIITQIKGKTATELLSSRHPPPNITPNFYSTTKTTSTSLSSKSASPKFGTATWNDFHFPPPPPASNENNYDGNVHHYASTLVREQAEKVLKIPSTSLLIGAELGNGKHTVVRECHVSTLGNVAYKTAKDRNSFHARNALIDELKTLTLTTNPHIVRLLATDDSGGLLLELVAEGNVKQYLQSQPVATPITQLLGFCADVCEGMRYLESLGLVHGHLSPTNILLDENLRAKVLLYMFDVFFLC